MAKRSASRKGQAQLLCRMLRLFYDKGWVAGTGGGICAVNGPKSVLMAPTGVHKEAVKPSDLFVVDRRSGAVIRPPKSRSLTVSECAPIFCAIMNRRSEDQDFGELSRAALPVRARGAGASEDKGRIIRTGPRYKQIGSVMHSHALSSVLAADLAGDRDHIVMEGLEMLKGIRGVSNQSKHAVPVIHNTSRERDLLDEIRRVLENPLFEETFCILVRDHGAYIWGEDIWETKRHAEVYHFLFEAVVARSERNQSSLPR
ncbi:MAG: class II aldolase/adducin family protein [Nitrospirae bacterium]|nr:class II aldolase/adducin family protein [Nitrospirota bacterium]